MTLMQINTETMCKLILVGLLSTTAMSSSESRAPPRQVTHPYKYNDLILNAGDVVSRIQMGAQTVKFTKKSSKGKVSSHEIPVDEWKKIPFTALWLTSKKEVLKKYKDRGVDIYRKPDLEKTTGSKDEKELKDYYQERETILEGTNGEKNRAYRVGDYIEVEEGSWRRITNTYGNKWVDCTPSQLREGVKVEITVPYVATINRITKKGDASYIYLSRYSGQKILRCGRRRPSQINSVILNDKVKSRWVDRNSKNTKEFHKYFKIDVKVQLDSPQLAIVDRIDGKTIYLKTSDAGEVERTASEVKIRKRFMKIRDDPRKFRSASLKYDPLPKEKMADIPPLVQNRTVLKLLKDGNDKERYLRVRGNYGKLPSGKWERIRK